MQIRKRGIIAMTFVLLTSATPAFSLVDLDLNLIGHDTLGKKGFLSDYPSTGGMHYLRAGGKGELQLEGAIDKDYPFIAWLYVKLPAGIEFSQNLDGAPVSGARMWRGGYASTYSHDEVLPSPIKYERDGGTWYALLLQTQWEHLTLGDKYGCWFKVGIPVTFNDALGATDKIEAFILAFEPTDYDKLVLGLAAYDYFVPASKAIAEEIIKEIIKQAAGKAISSVVSITLDLYTVARGEVPFIVEGPVKIFTGRLDSYDDFETQLVDGETWVTREAEDDWLTNDQDNVTQLVVGSLPDWIRGEPTFKFFAPMRFQEGETQTIRLHGSFVTRNDFSEYKLRGNLILPNGLEFADGQMNDVRITGFAVSPLADGQRFDFPNIEWTVKCTKSGVYPLACAASVHTPVTVFPVIVPYLVPLTQTNYLTNTRSPSASVQSGIDWLRAPGRQAADGSWYGDPAVTSFAVVCMLNWGYDETDPMVSKGIDYVLSKINPDGSVYNQSHRYTYYTSVATLPLAATHNPDYHDELEKMRNWLIGGQWDGDSFYGSVGTDHSHYGGWGYGNSTRPDLSNTQWALMGLKAADRALGLHADSTYDKCADYFLARCRNADGGSAYTPGDTSVHTMTAASVWSYSLCGRGAGAEVLGGLQWLSDRYSLTNNDGWGWWSEYYYKVTLAKALTMTHKTKLGIHEWFAELAAKLAEEQSAEGNWPDTGMMGSEMSTCWAIMALQTKTFPPDADLGFWATLESHADLHVYDPLGRHTGVNYATNSIEENIPGSTLKIIDPQGNEVPYDGSTPDDGYRQVFQLTQVIPGTYRVELMGTSDGPYHLTLQGLQDGQVVTTNGYEGDITKDKRLATNATMTAMEGAMTIIYEDLEVMPVLGVDPDKLAIMADPGVTKATSFTVKEIGGERVMHDVTMYCTDIAGPGGTVDGDSVTFDVGDFDVPAGGQQLVNASIPIPATFAGVATGSIVVESTDGGTRAIEVALLSLTSLRDYLEVSIGMPLYDGRTGLYYVNLGIKNLSDKPFVTPLWLVLDDISNPSISLAEADGTTPEGKPYVDVSDELGDEILSPGETLRTRLVFGMDGRRWTGYLRRFTFNLSVLGVVSDAPIPTIEAEVEVYPKVLNIANKDRFIVLIRLPKGYSERDIDISSVTCMGAPAIEGKMTFDGRLMVQFDTGALVGVEPSEAVEFKVEGQLTYGTPFAGTDTIKVISRSWQDWWRR